MAGERADTTEIEDVLDRLEVWHRDTSPSSDAIDENRSESAARR
jgi:hypothetical protein